MYIRNYNNTIVKFNIGDFPTEKKMYIALWKLKYNIDLSNGTKGFNIDILNLNLIFSQTNIFSN